MLYNNIIIFTGHDMVGKTTIAKKLSQIINIPYFKSSKQSDSKHNHLLGLEYSIEELTQFLEQTKISVILDRFHESEYVYSKVLGRETNLDKIFEIDKRLSKLKVKFIYCFKDENKYLEDDLNLIDKNKYNALKEVFLEFFNKSECETLFVNTSDENLNNQIKSIINFIYK